jgi:hypothetical protein
MRNLVFVCLHGSIDRPFIVLAETKPIIIERLDTQQLQSLDWQGLHKIDCIHDP